MLDISELSDENRFQNILSNILVPRIVGTAQHEAVKEYIVNFFKELNWTVEQDHFEEFIPVLRKNVNFTTLVTRLNDEASRYLVLACHYDSKYMKDFTFYAATDSAVPCAMLLDLAFALNSYLELLRKKDVSLMFIFFDGEEAFDRWSATDSIYGARHLAKLWDNSLFEKDDATQMQRIDVMMLLDLIGTQNPKFYYYDPNVKHLHFLLADIQNKLSQWGALTEYSNHNRYFLKQRSYNLIEDDHIPFVRSNTPVPILHLIPTPFPSVWHTESDNYDVLHFPTIDNLNKIFRVFVVSYLKGSFDEEAYSRSFDRSKLNDEL
ncbi:glutaminyl-peptide cyclotransferase-like isoform X2 [Lycorma delicatula]|uniref:glutaminyl-peptide cyclotransferase-like isoform X2 n=1 Tax=Lycorma delicatula TaxID=130591 RepID=UPI003F51201E